MRIARTGYGHTLVFATFAISLVTNFLVTSVKRFVGNAMKAMEG